ncbi:MAG: toll/interleukin-1 receptor domain-containing protein, partial [Rhodothermales bacterium]|nr:toll/interleukin-1 receptor domain-containing protein [Rhodothermales bacterium]
MAYVDDDGHDVFISYAHIDNEDDGADVRWVEAFGKQLSVRLLKHLGEGASVWWDPELNRSHLFDEVIQNAVRKSAVMVSLVSPSYEKSDYCRQELAWFAERGNLRTAASRSCVLPVLLYKMPFDRWPEMCKGCSGFEFFDPEASSLSRPLDVGSKAFSDRQWILIAEIAAILDELKAQRTVSSSTPEPQGAQQVEPYRVFLATASDDLAGDRRYLKKELQKEGIEIISKIPPPHDEKGHAQAAMEAVTEVDLSVHLLGNYAGTPIDEDLPDRTYPIEQTKIALEHAKRQLILLPETFSEEAITDDAYGRFMDDLQHKPRSSDQLQIIKDSRHQMVSEVLEARRRDRLPVVTATAPGQSSAATAFVDLHVNDLNHISELVGYLANRSITTVTVPSAGMTPKAG